MIQSEKLLGNQSCTLTINLKDHNNNTISGTIYWKKSTDSSYSSTSGSTKTITADKGTSINYYVYYYASGKEYGTSSTYTWTASGNTTKTFKGAYTTSTETVYQMDSNFTKQGSPSITSDGIASGFDASNYIKSTVGGANIVNKDATWEAQIKFKITSSGSSYQGGNSAVFGQSNSQYGYRGLNLDVNASNLLKVIQGYTSTYCNFQATISTNTWYTVYCKFDASKSSSCYTVTCNNLSFTEKTNGKASHWSTGTVYFGCKSTNNIITPAKGAVIDLKECWIKQGGGYVMRFAYDTTAYSYYWTVS